MSISNLSHCDRINVLFRLACCCEAEFREVVDEVIYCGVSACGDPWGGTACLLGDLMTVAVSISVESGVLTTVAVYVTTLTFALDERIICLNDCLFFHIMTQHRCDVTVAFVSPQRRSLFGWVILQTTNSVSIGIVYALYVDYFRAIFL